MYKLQSPPHVWATGGAEPLPGIHFSGAEPLLGIHFSVQGIRFCAQVIRVSLPMLLLLQARPVPFLAPQLWPLPELPSPWAQRSSPRALLVAEPYQNSAPHQL